MHLIERKPTLSDFFGIAVSGLSVSQPPKRTRNRRYSHRRIDQLRARTISTTTQSDPSCLSILALARALRKSWNLTAGGCQPALDLALCQILKTNKSLHLNVHIFHHHHDKPRNRVHLQQHPTHVCQKRGHLVIAVPTFISLDQKRQREVFLIVHPCPSSLWHSIPVVCRDAS